MKTGIIKTISACEILDSRGNPTLCVSVSTDRGRAEASVPSGASRGTYEAIEKRDGEKERFRGLGVRKAIKGIENVITPILTGMDVFDQEKIDERLCEIDGTANKARLGANAILGVSLAVAKTAALIAEKPLYSYLKGFIDFEPSRQVPYLFMNLINGGKHASTPLAFQEYHIVPQVDNIEDALNIGTKIFYELRQAIQKEWGLASANIGDEGGLVPEIADIERPLEILMQVIEKLGEERRVKLALDAAASSFYEKGSYSIADKKITSQELLKKYQKLIKKYPILSIEDPFWEEDFESFANLAKEAKKQNVFIVGDDLTATNSARINEAIKKESISGVIIKPNQIGTLTETLQAVKLARQNNLVCIISHRSGETNDDFIADLAFACGAFGLKAGAPVRGERVAKYNRLWEITKQKQISKIKNIRGVRIDSDC